MILLDIWTSNMWAISALYVIHHIHIYIYIYLLYMCVYTHQHIFFVDIFNDLYLCLSIFTQDINCIICNIYIYFLFLFWLHRNFNFKAGPHAIHFLILVIFDYPNCKTLCSPFYFVFYLTMVPFLTCLVRDLLTS